MKIAYLSTFYPFRGGIAAFNARLYNELSKNNIVNAYNFTTQYPNFLFPGKTQMVEKGDNAEPIESIRVLNSINPLSYYYTKNKINEFDPDILLTKFWMPYFAPSFGYISGKLKKLVSISILDNVIPHELRYGDMSLIKYFLNRTDAFVVMSDAVLSDLLSIKPNAKFIQHQHPLYDNFGNKILKREARTILGIHSDKRVILCFGFIRDYKGIDLAIKAMRNLDNSYHLIIAGEVYGSFEKYQKLIDEIGVSSKISLFTKYISDDEASIFFSASDICLLPYKSATQSGIVAISYHFDLPVIATRVGGLNEMIEPFGSGLMVENTNPDSIASKIVEYFNMNNNDFINNINNYKKKASWKSLSNAIIDLAKEIKKSEK